jgi:hypothetical protein
MEKDAFYVSGFCSIQILGFVERFVNSAFDVAPFWRPGAAFELSLLF